MKKYEFILENLKCAHCASKIENKIKASAIFSDVKFAVTTMKLQIIPTKEYKDNFCDEDTYISSVVEELQVIVDSIEDGVHVRYLATEEKIIHKHGSASGKLAIIEVIIGISILLATAIFTEHSNKYMEWIILIAFVIIGRYVLFAAIKNAKKGRFMDENLLMGLATIGAVIIGDYKEALGVMVFYRIGTIFEERATDKSRNEIMSVIDMRPETVQRVNMVGITETIPANEAVVGDIIQVRVGDRIPLDGTVVYGVSRVDTSPVTGESKPVLVQKGTLVISGCINTSAVIKIRVDKPLSESFVTKILDSVEMATVNKPKVDRFITRFANYYTPAILLVTAITMLMPPLFKGEWQYWIYTGLTFLVISCPCAIVLSVPLSFFAGIGGSSKLGILFKGGKSMEAMTKVKVIALDKTGTITQGVFRVQGIETVGKISNEEIISKAASVEAFSSHPIANSICEKAKYDKITIYKAENVIEYSGEGIVANVCGTQVACGNKKLFERLNISIPKTKSKYLGATIVFVAFNNVFQGQIIINDKIKEDAKQSIAALQNKAYQVVMLTGDRKESADVIAKQVGITQVYSDLLPQDKLAIINSLQKTEGDVLFVGDGINDSPVLAGANVGGAMGNGADAAIEAADVVFMNGEIKSLYKALYIAKSTVKVAWENVFLALGIKLVVIVLGLLGYASLWMAIFADTGVLIICILNSIRLLHSKLY